MKSKSEQTNRKGGKFLPALLQTLGILMLVVVIVTAIPLSLPRLFGYEIYNVISPSMEPLLPMGTLIYTKQLVPETVQEGDVIAFLSNGSVVTHRVVKNRFVEGDFLTKGDANDENDPSPISYGALIGRMEFHIPLLGNMLSVYSSFTGKIYILLLALSGYLCTVLAGRLRDRNLPPEPEDEEEEEEEEVKKPRKREKAST